MNALWLLSASPSEIALKIVLSLIWTILLYGTGPTIFAAKRKKAVSPKKVHLFCIIYTFCAWLFHNILNVGLLGGKVSHGTAALLWGFIFHAITVKRLKNSGLYNKHAVAKTNEAEKASIPCIPIEQTEAPAHTITTNDSSFYEQEKRREEKRVYGPLDPPEKREQKYAPLWLTVCLAALCVCLCVGCGVLYFSTANQVESLQSELHDTTNQLKNAKSNHNSVLRMLQSLEQRHMELRQEYDEAQRIKLLSSIYVGITSDQYDDGTYFHTWSCSTIKNSDSFHAWPTKTCVEFGMAPCASCHSSQEIDTICGLFG